jgi:glycosyltransferase involved in cell wall biosynthesis
MKLLILTQTVDKNDPILGFFHRWIEEFAKHCEKVTVICLEMGKYRLPENVKVLSLGKEKLEASPRPLEAFIKIKYIINFYCYIWQERKNYDAVFVHMNQIYVILGALVWRSLGKKVGLWYTHKQVSRTLRLAEKMASVIFSASKESFRLKSEKVCVMGHGIDTDFFSPDHSIIRDGSWLSVGRLMLTKRHDRAIKEAAKNGNDLRIIGSGPEKDNLVALARKLGSQVIFLGSMTHEGLRDEYRRSSVLIHRSETGSLDKVVLEAASCGMVVDSTDQAISKLSLSREYVVKHHALPDLIKKILQKY